MFTVLVATTVSCYYIVSKSLQVTDKQMVHERKQFYKTNESLLLNIKLKVQFEQLINVIDVRLMSG